MRKKAVKNAKKISDDRHKKMPLPADQEVSTYAEPDRLPLLISSLEYSA